MNQNLETNNFYKDIPLQGELFLPPFTFFAFDQSRGILKNLANQHGVNIPPVLAEACGQLDGTGPVLEAIKCWWNKKTLRQKWNQTQQVYQQFNLEFKAVLVEKDAVPKMICYLLWNLSQKGLLQKRSQFREHFSLPQKSALFCFGIVTGDRPTALYRCLESYLRNFQLFSRAPEIFVSDYSRSASAISANKSIIAELALQFNVKIHHLDFSYRTALVHQQPSKNAQKAMETLLFGNCELGQTYGLNRNTLHFATLGSRVLSVDDDTIANTFVSQNYNSSICFNAESAQVVRTFAHRQEAKDYLQQKEIDILADHEATTGQSLSWIIGDRLNRQDSKLSGLAKLNCSHLIHQNTKVMLSMNSLVGDSGSGSALGFLYASGQDEQQLFSSYENFNELSKSREITKSCDEVRIHDAGPCMTTFFSYDNSEPLIPFFPHFRMEDDIFKCCTLKVHPQSKLAYLPIALEHAPLESRGVARYTANSDSAISNYDMISEIFNFDKPNGISSSLVDPLKQRRVVLEDSLNFLQQDFSLYKKQLTEQILTKKFIGLSSKFEKLKSRKGKIPSEIYAELHSGLLTFEKLLGEPTVLADPSVLDLTKNADQAERIQHQMTIEYVQSCLELAHTNFEQFHIRQ